MKRKVGAKHRLFFFGRSHKHYSLPTIEIDIQNQELALRRFAPQRLIFHWEGSMCGFANNLFNY